MGELKHKESLPVQASASDNVLTVRFDNGISNEALQVFASQMHEMMEKFQAKMEIDNERTIQKIDGVEKKIKAKHISPQDLGALESLVHEKATAYVSKRGGIQTSIDVFLNYDEQALRDMRKLVNKEHGRIKQRIWVELNKECLHRKGTAPKNRIKDTQVERAFDFVRRWGGFSI